MEFKRQRYQFGSLRSRTRKNKPAVWQFRWWENDQTGRRVRRGKDIGTSDQYKTERLARRACEALLLRLNSNDPRSVIASPSFGAIIDRYIEDERLREIKQLQPGQVNTFEMSYSTADLYLGSLENYLRPRWGSTAVDDIKAMAVQEWLKALDLSSSSRSHIRGLMHRLFDRAMLWEMTDIARNPIELIKIRGMAKRQKKPMVLTPEEFWKIYDSLQQPSRIMSFVAVCTGLRQSELVAMQWSKINFEKLIMLVDSVLVRGRSQKVKTEYSCDELPLDPDVATLLLEWKQQCTKTKEGWLFPNPHTGQPYLGGSLQAKKLKPAGKSLGLSQPLGWHTFRHTFRSWMDATGAPIGVQQKLMRHADVSTTMNIYGSALLKSKRETSSKVLEMVRRTG